MESILEYLSSFNLTFIVTVANSNTIMFFKLKVDLLVKKNATKIMWGRQLLGEMYSHLYPSANPHVFDMTWKHLPILKSILQGSLL